MKKTILLISLIAFFAINSALFAQVSTNKITGKLVESGKNSPIEFASVMLLNPQDSSVVKGAMTDKNGAFLIDEIPSGKYLVKTLFLGYKDWFSEEIALGKSQKSVDLGTISLVKDENMLQGAEIVYVKPLFEQKAGKTIMNVESNPSVVGDNVIELLRKMPGVTVDNNDNITVQGKSGALILIDDKDPHLSGDDLKNYLRNMPSSIVDRVEVMKNPSARYDASGTAGIINIVTKKDSNKGVNGSVWAGTGYNGMVSANTGFNLNARLGKVVLTGSYYYGYYPNRNGYTSEHITHNQGDTIRHTANEMADELWNNRGNWQSHGFNFGTDYFIDKRNSISFSYNGNLGRNLFSEANTSRIYHNGILTGNYKSANNGYGNYDNHQLNLNYKHDFDTTGKVLYADITYSINQNKSDHENSIRYFTPGFGDELYSITYRNLNDPNQMQVLAAKLDYEHPFNDKISLECGIKSSLTQNRINSYNFLGDSIIENMSNQFKYLENINAAYISGSFTVSKEVSIRTGLRAEQANISGRLFNTGETYSQHYIDLFPNLQIDYNLPKMNTLSLTYNSRINRPGYWSLNPYVVVEDDYTIRKGNPHLKPEYTHSLTLSHSWKYMLFTSVSYNYLQGNSQDMVFTDKETGVRMSLPQNLGKGHVFNADFYARIPIGKWWVMSYSLDYKIGRVTFDYGSQRVSNNLNGFTAYTSQEFTFLKNYSINVGMWWNPKHKSLFGSERGQCFVWAGAKAQFLKKTLTVSINVNDIFNQGRWIEDNRYPDGSRQYVEYHWLSRGVNLSISYRFGKQEIQRHQRKQGNDDELNRMGGGGGNSGGQK